MITIDINRTNIKQLSDELKYLYEQYNNQSPNYKEGTLPAFTKTYYALSRIVTCKNCKHYVEYDDGSCFHCSTKCIDYNYTNLSICSNGDFEPRNDRPTFQLF